MISHTDSCTGCNACKYICPKSAIAMQEDLEGFRYPIIELSKCINCGLCNKVCSIDKPINSLDIHFSQKYYYAKLTDSDLRKQCQSGGVGFAIADHVLRHGGVVYGVVINEQQEAVHIRIDNVLKEYALLGSKYVQSDFSRVYSTIEQDILNPFIAQVCVIGTPCQIAGIKKYLDAKKLSMKKTLFVDFICHGVASPKIWKNNLDCLFGLKRNKISKINFRDKKFGWSSHVESYRIGRKYKYSNLYTQVFYREVINRPSCAKCTFTNFEREADITLGDFWGYKQQNISYDRMGISSVIVNSQKGELLISELKSLMIETATKEATNQHNLNAPTIVDSERRKFFWETYTKCGYKKTCKKLNIKSRSIRFKIRLFLSKIKQRVKSWQKQSKT